MVGVCIYSYTVKGQKYSTTMNFTHYIRSNCCRKNLLELKNKIEVYKFHKIGWLRSTLVISFEKYSILMGVNLLTH